MRAGLRLRAALEREQQRALLLVREPVAGAHRRAAGQARRRAVRAREPLLRLHAVEQLAQRLRGVSGATLSGAAVDTYNDHRMAMSLALVGLRVPGVSINDPQCTEKTYPNFFRDLADLRQAT